MKLDILRCSMYKHPNTESVRMRRYFLIAALLLSATPVLAQQYPQTSSPQQEAYVVAYPQVPMTYPQPAYVAPAQLPTRSDSTRPTDAGQSVVTDIRQMNF